MARLAASACSRASPSSRSVSARSVMSRPTHCNSAGGPHRCAPRPRATRSSAARAASRSLIVDARAVDSIAIVPCSSTGSAKSAADQRVARPPGNCAKRIVDEDDARRRRGRRSGRPAIRTGCARDARPPSVPNCDRPAPRSAGRSCASRAQLAHPHTYRRQRGAGQREQETRADREGVRIIASAFGAAAGDEAIGAAEGGRKNREGAQGGRRASDSAARSAVYINLMRKTPPIRATFPICRSLANAPRRSRREGSGARRAPWQTMRRRPCKVIAAGATAWRCAAAMVSETLGKAQSEAAVEAAMSGAGADDQGGGLTQRKVFDCTKIR